MVDHIVGLRPVHEIISGGNRKRKQAGVVLAFVQWGNPSDGYRYENVCPWCSKTVGYVDEEQDAGGVPLEMTDHELYKKLQEQMATHMLVCTAGGFKLAVQKTKVPLNTENLPRVM